MIPDELIKLNKAITRLRYEYDEYEADDSREVLDNLQFHIFLAITYFEKSEVTAVDVKQRLIEKIAGVL